MFRIQNNTIELTRGDEIDMKLSIKDYTFQAGDKVEFRVYNKRGMNEKPVISKSLIVDDVSESVTIHLTNEETKVGEMLNKAIIYWYEVELNDEITIIGYDDNGAKELIMYPEGDENE